MKKTTMLLLAMMLMSVGSFAATYQYVAGEGLRFSWSSDDKVGVTTGVETYGITQLLTFWTRSTAMPSPAQRQLYAVGYLLNPTTPYYSFSPYRWMGEFDATDIECSYEGQSQSGNATTAHLAAYDYMQSATLSTADACTFDYQHTGAVLRITFHTPQAMTVSRLTLAARTPAIVTGVTMNLKAQTVQPTQTAQEIALSVSSVTAQKGGAVTLYLFLPQQDLSAETLQLSITDDRGTSTSLANIKGMQLRAGRMYDIDLTATAATARAMTAKGAGVLQETTAAISYPLALAHDIGIDEAFALQLVPKVLKGDVNSDGEVDILDAIALTGYYTNNATATLSLDVCDMNGDGDIDILDVIAITSKYTQGQ